MKLNCCIICQRNKAPCFPWWVHGKNSMFLMQNLLKWKMLQFLPHRYLLSSTFFCICEMLLIYWSTGEAGWIADQFLETGTSKCATSIKNSNKLRHFKALSSKGKLTSKCSEVANWKCGNTSVNFSLLQVLLRTSHWNRKHFS